MNYEQSLQWLYDLQFFGTKLGLANTKALLSELGEPHQKLKVVHVAGTNGKGSVCAILTSVLKEAGYKVGTYTSPHLNDFGERIAINGFPMTRGEFVRAIGRIKPKVEELACRRKPMKCTFFETSTCLAFDHFARRNVDFAVVEVGMGGRLDSTNVVNPIISIITNIGLEHTEHLGSTLEEIAGEKAGIIKKGTPVICGVEHEGALKVIRNKAKKMNAGLIKPANIDVSETDAFGVTISLGGERIRTKLAGSHQAKNLAVAISAIEELRKQGVDVQPDAFAGGIEKTMWPGRLQFARLSPPILLDAAHNPSGAEKLARFLADEIPGKKIIGIIGMLKDKDAKSYVSTLEPVLSKLMITTPDYDRGLAAEDLADAVSGDFEICQSVPEAIDSAVRISRKENVILITGSIFTVSDGVVHLNQLRIGEIMKLLTKNYPVGAFPGKEVGENETTLGKRRNDPFSVLISTILSQRTRDENTHVASEALFAEYSTPRALAGADISEVEKLVRPAGFYKQKARKIIDTARALVDLHGSQVPDDMDALLALPGVGRKTANCVLVYGFGKPAMPVDTHVHRISNLWGLVRTKEPDDSETALIRVIPKKYWIDINRLMVRHGQVICIPTNPRCGQCFISHLCDTGIYKNRFY